MNERQRRFVAEYLIDLNATQAAIRAGYSPKTAGAIGFEHLKKPEIGAAIREAQLQRAERTEVTQDYVISRLMQNVERAMQIEPVLNREGLPTGEYVYQGAVANTALGLLGKHLGMFADKVELTGKDGAPLMPMEAAREAVEIAEKRGLTLVKDDGKRRAG